jgi:predicted metal-dependent HD superfamily phosphohydrolase
VLRGFLARTSIYHTDPFRERYEATARANITAALAALDSAPAAAPD